MLRYPMLIALAGLPAAGKTTLAEHLGRILETDYNVPIMVIASDSVRDEILPMRSAFHPELEPAVRKMTLDRIASGLAQGLSVIHDDLNYYRSMRFDLVSIARDSEALHALIHLATPVEDCLKHNKARGRKIPDEVIVKDAKRFDPPGLDPWDEPLAVLGSPPHDQKVLDELAKKLVAGAEKFTPWTPPVVEPHESTRLERLDLLARSIVGSLYRNATAKRDGQAISSLRHSLVEQADKKGLSLDEAERFFRQELEPLFR